MRDKKIAAGIGLAALAGFLAWKFWPRPPEDEEPLPVEGTATLRGYVTDSVTGKEIPEIDVTLNSLKDTTTFRGRYKFIDIEPISYELIFTDPLGRYASLNYGIVTLEVDKTKYVDVSLDLVVGTGILWGYVTDSQTGGVITGQSIQLLRDGAKITFDRTDATGKYDLVDVPAGDYTLFTESNIYQAHSEAVTITGIQRKDLVLEPKGVELGELMLEFSSPLKAILGGTLWNYGAITITNIILYVESDKPVTIERGVWREDRGDWYYPTVETGVQNLGTLLSGEPRDMRWRLKGDEGTYNITLTASGDNASQVSQTVAVQILKIGIFEYSNFGLEPKYSPTVPMTVTASIDIYNTGSYLRYISVEFLVNGSRIQPYDEGISYYNNGEPVRGFNMKTLPKQTSHIDVEYIIGASGTYEIALKCGGQAVTIEPCSIDADCPEGYECIGGLCLQKYIFSDIVYIG